MVTTIRSLYGSDRLLIGLRYACYADILNLAGKGLKLV
jgi:hypothetical protein